MNYMLQGVVNGGTGADAKLSDIIAGGKTGTGIANDDHWFVGFVPQYSLAVWHGGGEKDNYSPELFRRIFEGIDLDEKINYPVSGHVVQQVYCVESGKKASAKCGKLDMGYYLDTFNPGVCDIHK